VLKSSGLAGTEGPEPEPEPKNPGTFGLPEPELPAKLYYIRPFILDKLRQSGRASKWAASKWACVKVGVRQSGLRQSGRGKVGCVKVGCVKVACSHRKNPGLGPGPGRSLLDRSGVQGIKINFLESGTNKKLSTNNLSVLQKYIIH